jgi:hypothetical protein
MAKDDGIPSTIYQGKVQENNDWLAHRMEGWMHGWLSEWSVNGESGV